MVKFSLKKLLTDIKERFKLANKLADQKIELYLLKQELKTEQEENKRKKRTHKKTGRS